MSNDIPRKVMQTIHRDAYHPWMVIGLVILVATEAADFVLSYTACELLLGGNLTRAGLTTAAERAQGLTAGDPPLRPARGLSQRQYGRHRHRRGGNGGLSNRPDGDRRAVCPAHARMHGVHHCALLHPVP